MIISQTLGLEQSESHKSAYFGDTMPSPISLTASIPSVGHNSISGTTQGIYPPTDGYFIPNRVQADLSSMNMYVAQPESTSISSPGNYVPNPATVVSAPGLMGSHYAAGLQHPPCYPPLGEDYEMRSGVGGVWSGSYAQAPYPYENNFGPQYHYDRYCGMDINDGVRRKNATRESTNTLKAWLQEHKKNPYPTKGEKIMLAIITKMTLTQVSTWFANARRRLKKENKMTWVPKNRSSDTTGSKKTDDEDDDDVTSQLSQENESKSDIDQSIDSDDSDARKVTSTNINDDITTTTDLKETSNEFTNEQLSVTSDGTAHHHLEEHEFQPNEDQIRPNFVSYNHKDKSWSSLNKETDSKAAETINSHGISPPYPNNCYPGPSATLQQPSSIVNSTIAISEGMCPSNDVKYPSQWTSSAYSAYNSETNAENPRLPQQRAREQLETAHVRSPIHGNEVKPNISRDTFGLNGSSEPCSTSPVSSSYVHGFQHPLPQTIDYYRSVDRLGVDMNNSYYPHNDLRPELKHERVQSNSYPGKMEHGAPTTPKFSLVPSPSHSSTDSASSNQKPLHQHNLSPQYYPNVKLVKTVAPSTTSYTASYFQQDNFNHLAPPSANIDYCQRKGFYSPEASSFHLPSSTSPIRK